MKYLASPRPLLGPCRCQGCGEPLWWAKRPSRRLGILADRFGWREEDGPLHRCPALREATRQSLARPRAKGYNTGVGSSDNIANMHTTPFGSLTLSGGVAASRGQD